MLIIHRQYWKDVVRICLICSWSLYVMVVLTAHLSSELLQTQEKWVNWKEGYPCHMYITHRFPSEKSKSISWDQHATIMFIPLSDLGEWLELLRGDRSRRSQVRVCHIWQMHSELCTNSMQHNSVTSLRSPSFTHWGSENQHHPGTAAMTAAVQS